MPITMCFRIGTPICVALGGDQPVGPQPRQNEIALGDDGSCVGGIGNQGALHHRSSAPKSNLVGRTLAEPPAIRIAVSQIANCHVRAPYALPESLVPMRGSVTRRP